MLKSKLFAKIVFLLLVIAVLVYALARVDGTVRERSWRQIKTDKNIAQVFAGEQTVTGPVAVVTLQESWKEKVRNQEGKVVNEITRRRTINKVFFPTFIDYRVTMRVEERARGIYKSQVYFTKGKMTGALFIPSLHQMKTQKESTLEMVAGHIYLGISDIRGFTTAPKIRLGGEEIAVDTRSDRGALRAPFPVDLRGSGKALPITIDMEAHGLKGFYMAPVADQTKVTLKGDWPHPSFGGDFLPISRDISGKGFSAAWSVNSVASNNQASFAQLFEGGKQEKPLYGQQKFGLELVRPDNPYALSDRAVKYGFLFILLTFAAFFLFETLKKLPIHPVQYGVVGLAQVLFFLLLLSLSEHISFGFAYGVAAVATVLVITYYLAFVLRGLSRGLGFGLSLGVVYGALYVILRSEDHALVLGSGLLFALLAGVMIQTRNVDWYALGGEGKEVDIAWDRGGEER